MSRSTSRACVATCLSAAVIVTCRLVRSTSCVSSTDSSSLIALLNADCETNERISAARPKCSVSRQRDEVLELFGAREPHNPKNQDIKIELNHFIKSFVEP